MEVFGHPFGEMIGSAAAARGGLGRLVDAPFAARAVERAPAMRLDPPC